MIKPFMENGKTCFTVQTYGTDRYGKQVRRRRVLKDVKRAAAVKLERELNLELAALKQGNNYAGMTYEDFLMKEWYPHVDENFPTEYDSLKLSMNKWCSPIMHLKLESINPTDIKEILDSAGESLAHSTVKRLRSMFHRSFEFAVQGGLKSNPVASVKADQKRCKEFEPGVLTREEVNILLAKAKILKPEWYDVWAISVFTGLRIGELVALTVKDCSLQDKIITVNKSWNKKIGIKSTKNGRWRKVPIADRLLPVLQPLLLAPANDPVIKMNYILKKGDQSRVIRQFSQGIGITSIRHHDLRATFITQLFAAGASIAEVQAIVGHSDLKVTQRYLRLSSVEVKGVTNKLDFTLPSENERINNVVNIFK
jgi:integrase